jgi:hypothetical protein
MSSEELETYAQIGTLPNWFKGAVGATAEESHKRLVCDLSRSLSETGLS